MVISTALRFTLDSMLPYAGLLRATCHHARQTLAHVATQKRKFLWLVAPRRIRGKTSGSVSPTREQAAEPTMRGIMAALVSSPVSAAAGGGSRRRAPLPVGHAALEAGAAP